MLNRFIKARYNRVEGILCFKQYVKKKENERGEDIYTEESCKRWKLYNIIINVCFIFSAVYLMLNLTPLLLIIRILIIILLIVMLGFNLMCNIALCNIAKGKTEEWIEKYFDELLG